MVLVGFPLKVYPVFLFDLSRWMLCTAWYQSIVEEKIIGGI